MRKPQKVTRNVRQAMAPRVFRQAMMLMLFCHQTTGKSDVGVRVTFSRETNPKNAFVQIQPPNTHYSYAPTAMNDAGDGWKVWTCGGGEGPFDSIYFTHLPERNTSATTAPTAVLVPTQRNDWLDGHHACAPTVVQTRLRGDSVSEPPKFRLWYECAARIYDRVTGVLTEGFAQICHAVSMDGFTWLKYNASIPGGFGPASTVGATPVLPAVPAILNACDFGFNEARGRYEANFSGSGTCGDLGPNYGNGHPSAVVIDGVVHLWHYSSEGNFSDRAVFHSTSVDGIHFDFAARERTNLRNPVDVRAVASTPTGSSIASPFLYVATLGEHSDHYFAYSRDGITWVWADAAVVPALSLGIAVPPHCACPAQASVVADKSGFIFSPDGRSAHVAILADEGSMGKNDPTELHCYSPLEDKSRGATWAVYLLQGEFLFNGDVDAAGSLARDTEKTIGP